MRGTSCVFAAANGENPLSAIIYIQEWDEDLAAIASNYAQECTFNYNPHRHDLSTFSYVGENIAAIDSTGVHDPGPVYKVSGSGEARINVEYFVESVRKWFRDDAPFYSHDYHYCNPLARCHCRFYLQVRLEDLGG